MGKEIVTRYEIAENPQIPPTLSGQCDIEFIFTNLTSKAWKDNRLLIQRRADMFAYNPNKTAAYAGFKLTPATARKLTDIYMRIYTWKSVFVRVLDNEEVTIESLRGWFHCLLLAFASGTPETYCTIDDYDPAIHTDYQMWMAHLMDPERFGGDNIVIPCKCVRWNPDITHPSGYRQAYLNAAMACGCYKCPLFDMSKFVPKPSKKIEKK